MTTAYDFEATTIEGPDQSLADYKGKVLLVVNTASKRRSRTSAPRRTT